MPRRLAAVCALIVFSLCLLIGGIQAGNTFGTAISRALLAMGGTFAVGLILGVMAQKMLEENLRFGEKKSQKGQEPVVNDR